MVKKDDLSESKKVTKKTGKAELEEKADEELSEFKKRLTKKAVYVAIGRRKDATARVRLIGGVAKGEVKIFVNEQPVDSYFPGAVYEKCYFAPFKTTNTVGRFKVTIKVVGGGKRGQLDACVHGISRAIEQVDREHFRPILKKKGFLTRDPRSKERRKAGLAGKARAKKQSPKR